MAWEEFLTKKFGLWIDICFSAENTLHSSGRAVEKRGILLQIEKAAETVMVILHVTYLTLRMQWLTWVLPIPAGF